MANFPSGIIPSSRVYTPGTFPSSSLPTMKGEETNIRHSSASYGHSLTLTFKSIPRTDFNSILNHYVTHANYETFDLSTDLLTATNLTFPTGYKWRYATSPEVNEGIGQIDIAINLELLPPYNI
tara:strand:+ start:2990 stop:3361 length:372 start_codon:yes stop_codon:yes gene_type:complete